MKPTQHLFLSVVALALSAPAAFADDASSSPAVPLGDHPAVLVARRGVHPDPASNFYLHPARLSWSLQRPLSEGEHPAVLVARHAPTTSIDPNRFVVAHPARGTSTSGTQ